MTALTGLPFGWTYLVSVCCRLHSILRIHRGKHHKRFALTLQFKMLKYAAELVSHLDCDSLEPPLDDDN